ncbi:DNA-directed RNA polymerase subunit alpha [Patescibacteria group bacterium]|nr:DNA-directed RNA polymerase subunit alpha [Patescibacteria group bacterium]
MNEPLFETKQKKKGDYARFVISPLEQGYGSTLGNALRRVLLTSLPGAAVTGVKISGVKHQFSTLSGVKEDIVEFLLNLKKVRFTYDGEKSVKASLSVNGAGDVKAKEIKVPATVKIANPELVLATLSRGAKLDAQIEIESGAGYSLAEDREKQGIGYIPLDASFSPITRVNYKIEETRVGRLTNYDKLILEIWTDGTIAPKDALIKAAKTLVPYLNQIISPKKVKKKEEKKDDGLGQVGKLSVEEIGLPTRVANALVKAGYDSVEDLAKAKREDFVKVRNLGEKSIKIITLALKEKGVDFKE